MRETFDVSEFSADPTGFIDRLRRTGEPEYLTKDGEEAIVLQDAKTYRRLLEALDHLEAVEGIRRGLESMQRGEGRPAREVLEEIRVKYNLPKTS